MKATVSWQGAMSFRGESQSGHQVTMDAAEVVGGENRGPRPAEMVLLALGGCTGMDVVSILHKMRVEFDDFRVDLQAEVSPEHPKIFTTVSMVYRIWGKDVPVDRFKRAVELSHEKYCVVGNMINKAVTLAYNLEVNGQLLEK